MHYFLQMRPTVWVARVALPRVLPTQWSNLQKIVQNPLKSDENSSYTLLQFWNVTVSCVVYFLTQNLLCTFLSFLAHCVSKKIAHLMIVKKNKHHKQIHKWYFYFLKNVLHFFDVFRSLFIAYIVYTYTKVILCIY